MVPSRDTEGHLCARWELCLLAPPSLSTSDAARLGALAMVGVAGMGEEGGEVCKDPRAIFTFLGVEESLAVLWSGVVLDRKGSVPWPGLVLLVSG